MADPTSSFHREIAYKILLRQLHEGKMIQEEGVHLLMLPSLDKVVRVNVVATILIKEKVGNITNVLVDDGTGQVVLRFFEPLPLIEQIQIGNTILIIGKPRMYNQEVYLSPEIVKKVAPAWLQIRKKELPQHDLVNPPLNVDFASNQEEGKKTIVEQMVGEDILPVEKVINLIKELDKGQGVLVEELIEKSPLKETEALLTKMLERGEIFQNAPGKVKML
ncbi:MAG: hypothetical protein Q7K45_01975 [Nanoarchaeota archaeon]|nr:hypothetical protein [Nanoarchaeota archaeon]